MLNFNCVPARLKKKKSLRIMPSYNKTILLVLLLQFVCPLVYPQDISSAFKAMDVTYGSPNATEIAKYGNMDVSLYKGVPNIGIPIHQFKLRGLTFPVSLQYNAGGIMVDQISSSVGLGWTLHASGQINQIAQGPNDFDIPLSDKVLNSNVLKDFYPNGYSFTGDPNYYNDYQYMVGTERNFKPDLYTYSNGTNNGRFIIKGKNNGSGFGSATFHSVPFNNNKISHESGSTFHGKFIIIDTNGNIYLYDKVEVATTYRSCTGGFNVNDINGRAATESYTWHLGKITTPNGDELIFSYSQESVFQYQLPGIQVKYELQVGEASACDDNIPDKTCAVTKDVSPQMLTKIKWVRNGSTLEEVDFIYNQSRQDFGDSYGALSDIIVTKGGSTAASWDLTYGYFNSTGGSTKIYKRLKLLNIQQDGFPAHIFEYNQSVNLPHRGSFAQDYRGYYNGKTSNTSLIPDTSGLTGTGDRSSDGTKIGAWTIKKHVFPTGGSQEYTMESFVGGGLRVNNIINKDSDGSTLRTRYYNYNNYTSLPFNYKDDYEHVIEFSPGQHIGCNYDAWSASAVIPVTSYESSRLTGFGKVTILDEQNGNQGKTEIEFSTGLQHLDASFLGEVFTVNWGAGEKLKETIFNASNNIIHEIEFEYKVNHVIPDPKPVDYLWDSPTESNEVFIYAMDTKKMRINAPVNPYWIMEKFRIVSAWYHPEKTVETIYDLNGLNPVTTTTYFFYDNATHALQTRSESVVSSGNTTITKTYFPDDVSSTTSLGNDNLTSPEKSAIDKLKFGDQHRIATPIQVEIIEKNSGGTVLSKNYVRTNFKLEGSTLVVPKDIETLKGTYNSSTNPQEERITYNDYYPNGNVKEVSKKDGTSTVYIWGYDQRFPVAKIENATKTQVESLSAISVDYHAGSEALPFTQENAIRGLSGTLVTTYTFLPKAGVTSIKDPKGYETTYHYDELNQLRYIKDANGNVLSSTNYHYKGNTDAPAPSPFIVTPASMDFYWNGSSQTVSVTAGGSWTVSKSDSWITLSATSGSGNGSFTITPTTNYGGERTATVTVNNGSNSAIIGITQEK